MLKSSGPQNGRSDRLIGVLEFGATASTSRTIPQRAAESLARAKEWPQTR
jgi:hypothetical protein